MENKANEKNKVDLSTAEQTLNAMKSYLRLIDDTAVILEPELKGNLLSLTAYDVTAELMSRMPGPSNIVYKADSSSKIAKVMAEVQGNMVFGVTKDKDQGSAEGRDFEDNKINNGDEIQFGDIRFKAINWCSPWFHTVKRPSQR